MRKAKTKTPSRPRRAPSAESLREIPEIDFTKATVIKNPFAARIQAEGIRVLHDEPSAESLREIPEVDFAKATVIKNPFAAQLAATGIQAAKGRPKHGEESGPTKPRSVRLPESVWAQLKAAAERQGLTTHAAIRVAVSRFLDGERRSAR